MVVRVIYYAADTQVEAACLFNLGSAFNSLVQFIVTILFLLIFCELSEYVTKCTVYF